MGTYMCGFIAAFVFVLADNSDCWERENGKASMPVSKQIKGIAEATLVAFIWPAALGVIAFFVVKKLEIK